jgi:hypothetical protein
MLGKTREVIALLNILNQRKFVRLLQCHGICSKFWGSTGSRRKTSKRGIVQLVRNLPLTQEAAGSSPAAPAI